MSVDQCSLDPRHSRLHCICFNLWFFFPWGQRFLSLWLTALSLAPQIGWINKQQMNKERIVCETETLTELSIKTDLGPILRLFWPSSCTPGVALPFRFAAQLSLMLTLPPHPWHAQSCLTLSDPIDCSPPGSSVHGILQPRRLEWVAISFSRGSSQPTDRTQVSRIVGRCFTVWATREAYNESSLCVLKVVYYLSWLIYQEVS